MVEISSEELRRVQIHAALADPGRLVIVDRLLLGDASPSELQTALSMSSSLIAHHLGVLEGAGIVRRVRSEGDRRRSYLQLIPESLEALVPSAAWRADRVVFCLHRKFGAQPVGCGGVESTQPAAGNLGRDPSRR